MMPSKINIIKWAVLSLFLVMTNICHAQFCYSVSAIPYNPDPYNGGTNANLTTDDQFSGLINLPFPFCYDGTYYTQCLISSNGYISFNLGLANGFSDWQIIGAIPTSNPSTITNSILCPWQDLYIPAGGNIYYATYGVTPNRRFVVSYNNVRLYQCTAKLFQGQVVLYESTNNIDIICGAKQRCPNNNSWNNNWAIEGVQNATGTVAFSVAGRNATVWTTTNDAYRFTNTCFACSVLPISLISFTGNVINGSTNRLQWSCATETDNHYFTLERSTDGVTFVAIATIQGAGNSDITTSYSYDDRSFASGWNYYRLRQTDFNGVSKVFSIIALDDTGVDTKKNILHVINAIGQEINIDDYGFQIIYYDDGSIQKRINIQQ